MGGRPLRGIPLTLLLLCPCFNDAQAQDDKGWFGSGLMVHATVYTALLADVGYHPLGTTGSSPRWLVPIRVGVELR
jgi:hypothetical protein